MPFVENYKKINPHSFGLARVYNKLKAKNYLYIRSSKYLLLLILLRFFLLMRQRLASLCIL